jgi:hypothetical protein
MPEATRDTQQDPLPEEERLVPVSSPACPRAPEKAAGARFVLATDLDGTFLGAPRPTVTRSTASSGSWATTRCSSSSPGVGSSGSIPS